MSLKLTVYSPKYLRSVLNGLSPGRLLLLLITDAVTSLAVSGDRCSPDLLPVFRRLPSLALVIVELVDLFEGHVLGLVDHEPNENCCNPGEAAPDPEYIGLRRVQSAGQVGSDE